MGMLFGCLQHVTFRADITTQRHDDFLADGIDSRIGYLRKALFEVVIQHTWFIRHHRQSCIVTH